MNGAKNMRSIHGLSWTDVVKSAVLYGSAKNRIMDMAGQKV